MTSLSLILFETSVFIFDSNIVFWSFQSNLNVLYLKFMAALEFKMSILALFYVYLDSKSMNKKKTNPLKK